MEENKNQEEQLVPRYVPRPAWQVWGARIGLVLFLIFVVWQLVQIAGGFL